MNHCIFCEIIAGTAQGDIVYEDEHAVAFLDIKPLFPGHVLVVPRHHVVTLPDLPAEELPPYFKVVQGMTTAVQEAMRCEGIFVAQNNIVSQTVHHLHFHIVPRSKGDGLNGFFWPRNLYHDNAHKESVRQQIEATAAEVLQ